MAAIGKNPGSKETARVGKVKSLSVGLSAGVTRKVYLPARVQGFALLPAADIRFAVGEDVTALSSVSAAGSDVAADQFTTGGNAKANFWEERTIEEGRDRYLSLRAAAGTTVVIEVF